MYDQTDPGSLSNNSPRVIFQDRSGIIWIGTFGGGISVLDPKTTRFRRYEYDQYNPNSLSAPIVWAIAQGPDGDIWFGHNSGGLDRFHRATGRYVHSGYNPNDLSGYGGKTYVRSLLWDREGVLWIGSPYTGVYRYDPHDGSFINLHHDPLDTNSLSNDNVRTRGDRSQQFYFRQRTDA
jgi:ligand-binding sensor domain-containing protein